MPRRCRVTADVNVEYRVSFTDSSLKLWLGENEYGIFVARTEGVSFAAGVRAGDQLLRVVPPATHAHACARTAAIGGRVRWRTAQPAC